MTATQDRTWSDALDALEEWVRRTAECVGGDEPAAPDSAPPLPQGRVPDELRLRAQQLLHALGTVEEAVMRRRAQLEREARYGAA